MKNATDCARKLAALLKRLPSPPAPAAPAAEGPMARLILGFLQWNATQRAAQGAYQKLMGTLVDYNDLRVSHPQDIITLLGPRYPLVEERSARLRDTLQAVYRREHATSLDALVGRPKKEARAYLETLPGITPYVVGYVMLWSFSGGAAPVDERLAELLRQQKAAGAEASVEQISAFVERHVASEKAMAAHLALQAWADQQPPRSVAAKKTKVGAPQSSKKVRVRKPGREKTRKARR